MESSLRARQLSGLSRWEAVYELVKFLAVLLLFAQVSFADSGTYLNIIKGHSPTLLLVATEGVSKDTNGKVSSWKDLASGIEFVQATADNKPLLAADVNGVPVLRFDGSNDSLASTSTGAAIFANNAKTAFVAFRATSAGGVRRLFRFSDARFYLYQRDGTSNPEFGILNNDGNGDFKSAGVIVQNQLHIGTGWHDGTNIYAQLDNGTALSTASGNTAALTGTLQIAIGSAGEYWLGDIYAIVAFNTVLDEANRTAVYNALVAYLASKPKGEWQVSEGGRPWFR